VKTYEDSRISFSYPEELKLIRAKEEWGQYTLKTGQILITINIVSKGIIDNLEEVIWSHPPDDVGDRAKIEYLESVTIGDKQGIGHVATGYDRSHKFWGKIYRYLLSIPNGGLYIEISDRKDFSIDTYKDILESIKVRGATRRDTTRQYNNNTSYLANSNEVKLQYFSQLGSSLDKIGLTVEYAPNDNKDVKLRQKKALQEFQKKEKEIFEKVKASIYQYYHKIYLVYKEAMTKCYQIYNEDTESLDKMLNELLPEIKDGNELNDKIALSVIRVYDYGVIGLDFICSWDEEHGLGILLKNFEVKDVGLEEVSYFEDDA
jgi:hypothetical protein